MPISIGSNISSLKAQRQLETGTNALGKVFERLASGQRINKASDDAAGLAISSSLQADARIFTQAIRNGSDAISAIAIAEGGLSQLGTILLRITELAEQSANGVYSYNQLRALDTEAQALRKEYDRVIQTTEFNDISLLDGSLSNLSIQLGRGDNAILTAAVGEGLGRTVGDGTFDAFVAYEKYPAAASYVEAADFNGDGILDLASIPNAGNRIGIMLGNGDGSFSATVTRVNTGAFAYLATGDINNDGKQDIIGYGLTHTSFAAFLGNGDGTFKAQTTYQTPIGNYLYSKLIDVNADGNLDFANLTNTGELLIALGNGNGSFNSTVAFTNSIGASSGFTSFGDLNNDGKLDLLIGGVTNGNGSIMYGNGDGSFKLGSLLTGTGTRGQGNISDINGDGFNDILIATASATTFLRTMLGNGDGTFKASQTYALGLTAGVAVSYAAFDDLNGDGVVDLAAASNTLSPTMSILLSNGNGTYLAPQLMTAATLAVGGIRITDLNNDGAKDIYTFELGTANQNVNILLGNTKSVTTLESFSLLDQDSARETLNIMDRARARVSAETGNLGALLQRLDVSLNILQATRENYLNAASRISDADMAAETANLTRQQILQQAGAAVLAQANLQPQLALSLLRG